MFYIDLRNRDIVVRFSWSIQLFKLIPHFLSLAERNIEENRQSHPTELPVHDNKDPAGAGCACDD